MLHISQIRSYACTIYIYINTHIITYISYQYAYTYIYIFLHIYEISNNLILRVSEMFFFQCCAVSRWLGRGLRRAPRPLQSLATELFTEVPVLMSFDLVSFQEFFGVFFFCQGFCSLLWREGLPSQIQ